MEREGKKGGERNMYANKKVIEKKIIITVGTCTELQKRGEKSASVGETLRGNKGTGLRGEGRGGD